MTKFGTSQVNKPAPLWFRRLRDASINFLLPALGQLVTSLKISPETTSMWLQVLTFMPAAFNFIGVLLGDDVKKKVRVWVLLIGTSCLLSGCLTPLQLQKKEAIKQEKARKQELVILQKVREQLPCAPLKIIQGRTVYLPGDSIPCISGKCPPVGVRVDTLKVLDKAALRAVRDSLDQAFYILSLKDEHILTLQQSQSKAVTRADIAEAKAKKWQIRFFWLSGGILAVVVAWIFFSGKISLILKPFSWLLSKLR